MTTEYSKLKKELLFHEKRLSLLLGTRVVEELPYALKERQDSRWECFNECKKAIASLEVNAAAESKLSGRWSETRIASTFGLELPLVVVVGSDKFEKPSIRADDVAALLHDVQELSKRFSEFAPADLKAGQAELTKFLGELHTIQWTPKDIEKMKGAITSKLAVLTELTELTKSLKNSQYQVSCEELRLEELRREEEKAAEDGEMALSDAAIRQRMDVLKHVIDHLFFQSHTIDSSVDSNITKKRSNLTLFQEGTAVLSYLRGEKERLVATCKSDVAKINRGLEYEEKMRSDSQSLTMLKESTKRLEDLDKRQKVLSDHLERIAREFCEIETAMIDLGNERSEAIRDHIDLVESRRHLNSDNNEKLKFAEMYRNNLEHTREECERSIEALTSLEKLLLKQSSFDDYDFQATTRRLHTMQRRVSIEMNRTLNEYESAAAEIVRRLSAQLRVLSEQVDLNEVEAEIKKETFDPLAKKYVARAREFQKQRDEIANDCEALHRMVEKEREAIMRKIGEHLDPNEIVDNAEATRLLTAARSETILDYRQELLTPPDVGILDERMRVTREYQSSAAQSAARSSIRKANTSKVLAIREDVSRSKGDESGATDVTITSNPEDGELPCDVSNVVPVADDDAANSVVQQSFGKHNEERLMQYRGAARTISAHSHLD